VVHDADNALGLVFVFFAIKMPISCGVRVKIKKLHLSLSFMEVVEVVAFTPEIDCDQMAMDLPPVTSAVLLIAKYIHRYTVNP
jgi:hypothetical protein